MQGQSEGGAAPKAAGRGADCCRTARARHTFPAPTRFPSLSQACQSLGREPVDAQPSLAETETARASARGDERSLPEARAPHQPRRDPFRHGRLPGTEAARTGGRQEGGRPPSGSGTGAREVPVRSARQRPSQERPRPRPRPQSLLQAGAALRNSRAGGVWGPSPGLPELPTEERVGKP